MLISKNRQSVVGVMNTSQKTRKRYLEPEAWNDRLPKSTQHKVRKNAPAQPSTDVFSGERTVSSASESSDDNEAGESAEDIGRQNYVSSFVGDESASDCDTTDDEFAEDNLSNATQPCDGLPNSDFFRLEFARPLGNTNSLSVGDALVLVMDFAIKHGLSWTAVEDLLRLCNNILGSSVLPDSKYLFRKFCATSPEDMKFYFYCPFCNRLLAKTGGSLRAQHCVWHVLWKGLHVFKFYRGPTSCLAKVTVSISEKPLVWKICHNMLQIFYMHPPLMVLNYAYT